MAVAGIAGLADALLNLDRCDDVRALFGPIEHATMRNGFIASGSPFATGGNPVAAAVGTLMTGLYFQPPTPPTPRGRPAGG